MFEVGDRVQVNHKSGTRKGTIEKVHNPERGHEYYSVRLDEPIMEEPLFIDSIVAVPWDVFLVEENNDTSE